MRKCSVSKRAALILALAILFLLTAAAAVLPMGEAVKVHAATVQSPLESDYPVGTQLQIPDAVLSGTVGDEPFEVDARPSYVLFPSGSAISASGTLTLSEIGLYTVYYSAAVEGQTVTASDVFTVNETLYSVGSLSSVSYGKMPASAIEIVPTEMREQAPFNTFDALAEREGIILGLANGETFRYNRMIDVSDNTAADNLVSMFPMPETYGYADADRITLRFTDAYNENNYVEIYIAWRDEYWQWSMVAVYAAPNGQTPASYETSSGTIWKGIGGWGGRYINSSWAWNFSGVSDMSQAITNIRWDYAEQNIYASPSVEGDSDSVAKLTDYSYFEQLFEGFTTGEAFLSITASNYRANALNLMIYEIDGHDLSASGFESTARPVLSVDTEGYETDALPRAAVGVPYKIFTASAVHAYDGEVPVEAQVWYNYHSDRSTIVESSGGSFIPSRPGSYSIVYTATDRAGHSVTQVLDIAADTQGEMTFDIIGAASQGEAGTNVKLFDRIDPVGARGRVTYAAEVTFAQTGEIYDVDAENDTFFPMRSGAYTVRVVCSDYVSDVAKEFTVTVVSGSTPFIVDEPIIPQYFIRGAAYSLPDLSGYVFSDGEPTEKVADLAVLGDGITPISPNTDGKYAIGAYGSVTLRYAVTDGSRVSEPLEYVIPVIDTGYGGSSLQLDKYFYPLTGENSFLASLKETTEIVFRTDADHAAASDGRAEMQFINSVQARSFEFRFATLAGSTSMEAISIRLTDRQDAGNAIELVFTAEGSRTMVRVNGGTPYFLATSFNNPANAYYTVRYSSATKRIVFLSGDSTQNIEVPLALDGSAFEGFSGDMIYFSFAFEGVFGPAAVRVMRLNNQTFNNLESDIIAPEYMIENMRGERELGSTFTLPAASAADVLDPNVTLTLAVTCGGEYVRSQDGVLLDGTNDPYRSYSFVLDSTETYTIRYSASDSNRTATAMQYTVSVRDFTRATITLPEGYATSAHVGDTVTAANPSLSEQGDLVVYLGLPNGTITRFAASGGQYRFTAAEEGIYTVFYTMIDARGNFITESYRIAVSE